MAELLGAPALQKEDFNRLAEQNPELTPFQWTSDINQNNVIDPEELSVLPGYDVSRYLLDIQSKTPVFSPKFEQLYLELVELKRREVVEKSLAEAREIHVEVDFSDVRHEEQQMIGHIKNIADMINDLYHEQLGTKQYDIMADAIKREHPASYQLYMRNQGPFCEAPKTAEDPFCNALPNFPKQNFGIYPENLMIDQTFCDSLDGDLADPMTVLVTGANGAFEAVFFHEYYAQQVDAIALELEVAAESIKGLKDEKLLHDYFMACAKSFRTGDWLPSDRIWVSMNNTNSKYAVRIGPDETYWDPCQGKAGYELWFGRINQDAAKTISVFETHKNELENELASLTPYYQPREIDLDVPSFVNIALFEGDARMARGGMKGQALPNWTYEEVGFRQNIMLGFNSDPASQEMYQQKAEALLHPETLAHFTTDPTPSSVNCAAHELTHSIGPGLNTVVIDPTTGEAKVNEAGEPLGTKESLGNRYRTSLEELRAETGALYWTGFFLKEGLITQEQARQQYTTQLMWALDKVSKGMLEANGTPKTYSQLAAVQLHHNISTGALEYRDGRYKINFDLYHASVTELLQKVMNAQMTGDREAVEALFVPILEENDGYTAIHAAEVTETLSAFPDSSYVFAPTGLDTMAAAR